MTTIQVNIGHPILFLPLDEYTGTAAHDHGPLKLDGTIHGASWVAAHFGYGLSLDGNDDYIDFGDILNFDANDSFTILAWFQSARDATWRSIMVKRQAGAGTPGYSLVMDDANNIQFDIEDGATVTATIDLPIPDTGWHFIAAVRDKSANQLRLYVDMVPEAPVSDLTGDLSNAQNLYIGSGGNVSKGKGIIDEVRVFDRVLSVAEITDYYLDVHSKRVDIWRESLAGVGRWEARLDNALNYFGGLLASEDVVDIKINGVNMLKGYLDDVFPNVDDKAAVYLNLLRAIGRDYGFDLAELFLTKKYVDTAVEDILDDALSEVSSELELDTSVGLAEVDTDFKEDYLSTKFRDLVKQVDADYYVNDEKLLKLFALSGVPPSYVLLKAVSGDATNNILSIGERGEQVGVDIKRYIKIISGDVNDHWTENNADGWTGYHCTVSNELTAGYFLAGKTSIKAVRTGADPYIYLDFDVVGGLYGYTALDYSKVGSETAHILAMSSDAATLYFTILLQDGAGHSITYRTTAAAEDEYRKYTFTLGPDNELINWQASPPVGQWMRILGQEDDVFDWSTISFLGIRPYELTGTEMFWADGLYLPGIRAIAIASTSGRNRMIPIYRTDLKSQKQLEACAADELAKRMYALKTLKLSAVGDTNLRYSGQTVGVLAPDSWVGQDNRYTSGAGAGDGSSVVCASFVEEDDTWNQSYIKVLSGPSANEVRPIGGWDVGTHTFTIAPAFSNQIGAGILFEVYRGFRVLNLHHIAEPHVDLLRGYDYIMDLELAQVMTSPILQSIDPLRLQLSSSPMTALISRLENRLRSIEKA